MNLRGNHLSELLNIVTQAFNKDDFWKFVRVNLEIDIYDEFGEDALNKIAPKFIRDLEKKGLILTFIDELINKEPTCKRSDLTKKLFNIQNELNAQLSNKSSSTTAISNSVLVVTNNLNHESVDHIVRQYETVLYNLTTNIEQLRSYKALHDILHNVTMQYNFVDMLAKEIKKLLSEKKINQTIPKLLNLKNVFIGFKSTIIAAKVYVKELPDTANIQQDEFKWINKFEKAVLNAEQASISADFITLLQNIQELRSLLRTVPTRINTLIIRTAEEIDLTQLVDLLSALASLPELTNASDSFAQSLLATEKYNHEVKAHINQHNLWQEIYDSCERANEIVENLNRNNPWDFDALWKGIKEKTDELVTLESKGEWVIKIVNHIGEVDKSRAIEDFSNVSGNFKNFQSEAKLNFFAVDTNLKDLANEIKVLAVPLRRLLSML